MTMFACIGPVFYKVVYMSLTALVAGAAVLLLRRLADKRFSPFWKYAMWVLVLAALVVPWRPQSRAAVLAPAEAVEEISFREAYSQAQMAYSATLAQAQAASPEIEAARKEATLLRAQTLAFDELLPLLWLCGTAGAAAFMGIGALRLRRCIRRSQITGNTRRYEELLNKCKQRLGVKRRVRIVLQSHVGTPALLGLLRPAILLPSYAADMSDERLEYVILHELSHLRRGDGLVNALLLALRAVYWFNPLVWLLLRYVREDMELANDAAVLRGMGSEAQKEYSLSLVEVLMGCGKQRHAMLCMADCKKNIERRIGMIQLGGFFKKRKWVIAAAGVLVIAGIAALFLTKGISRGERCALPEAGVTVTVQLPEGLKVADTPVEIDARDPYFLEGKAIVKDGKTVGALMVGTLENIPQGAKGVFVDDPQQYRALFQWLPMGSLRYADDYRQVWLAGGAIEGGATMLIYQKYPMEEGQSAAEVDCYPTRNVLGYSLPLNRFVLISLDLDYGALTDEEHAAIAQSLRIAGSGAQPATGFTGSGALLMQNAQNALQTWLAAHRSFDESSDRLEEGGLCTVPLGDTEFVECYSFRWRHGSGEEEYFVSSDCGRILYSKDGNETYIVEKVSPTQEETSPLTLEQSISQAILQSYDGLFNAELHRTFLAEEANGLTNVYVGYEAAEMGWVDGHFAVQSAIGSCGIFRFSRDEAGVYTLEDSEYGWDHAGPPEWDEKTSGLDDPGYSKMPRQILFGFGLQYDTEPVNVTMVGKYLPEGVFSPEYMPDFEEIFGSDGSIVYYWSKTEDKGGSLQVIRKIELELCDDGVARYHFKDYGIDDGYQYPQVNLTLAQAGKRAADYARDFWRDGGNLSFKHAGQGAVSLYDPGKVENWQAKRGGKTYDVMVDLRIGAVVYAQAGERLPAQARTGGAQPLLAPVFLSPDTGREALKPLIWGSDGWWIDAQGDYIFAHFFRYIVRYDTKKNRIDKLIDLGEAPQYWWYAATYSPDGQSCVAQAREFDGPGQTGKVLIDLKKETVKPTEQEHYPHGMDSKPYQVDYQYDNGWFINKAEIKAMRPYTGANGTAVAIAMDRNRVGAILPSEAGWDALGYYKFAVVDLKQDKIVQECPMNVLKPGEVLSLYPPEPEPEPLLIDYHLQSVTVLRPRFPMDGRSSYDGFDVVKVVDAPADVASFEECLKSGAWTLTDAGGWIKGDPSSPQDHGILYMRGEDGRGLIAHLFSDPKKENPQGGAVALAMCDPMPAPPEKYRDSIGSDAFSRYWVAWDVYKILYGLAVSD